MNEVELVWAGVILKYSAPGFGAMGGEADVQDASARTLVPSGPAPAPVDEQVRLAESNLDRLLEWNSRYDTKMAVVLAMNTAMLGYLASVAPHPALWKPAFYVVVFATGGLLSTSLWFLYHSSYPRTEAPNESFFFFGTTAKIKRDEYARRFRSRSLEDHRDDLLDQSHRNSEIISLKFSALKWAFRLMLAAVIPWAIAIFFVREAGL